MTTEAIAAADRFAKEQKLNPSTATIFSQINFTVIEALNIITSIAVPNYKNSRLTIVFTTPLIQNLGHLFKLHTNI